MKEKGFNLNTNTGLNFNNKSIEDIKTQYAASLNNGLHGLCFSPYTEGQQTGDTVTEEQIRRRMEIIAPHTKWVRSFSCTEGHEMIPKIAHEKGLKSIAGAWISSDKERNEKEIKAIVKLAKEGLVDIVAVGNEVLQRNELSKKKSLDYLKQVRELIPDHIPIGYVDAYYQFIERPSISRCL